MIFAGGPAPASNAVIGAAAISFLEDEREVVGFFHGYSNLQDYHPITHRLVRAHGWEISASRRGDRTCFDVLIAAGEWSRRESSNSLSDDTEVDDPSEDARVHA